MGGSESTPEHNELLNGMRVDMSMVDCDWERRRGGRDGPAHLYSRECPSLGIESLN